MRWPTVLLLLLVLLAGCSRAAPALVATAAQPKATPSAPVGATDTPTPAAQPLPPATPFTVIISDVRLTSTSNAGMFAGAPAAPDEGVGRAVIQAAADRLAAFLNAMYVAPDTRLTPGAITVLTDPSALVPGAQAGLGVLQRDDVLGTVTGSASGSATLLMDGTATGTLVVRYVASLELVLATGRGPVEQSGVVTFVDRGAGLDLVAIDASTTYGGDLAGVLR